MAKEKERKEKERKEKEGREKERKVTGGRRPDRPQPGDASALAQAG